MANRATLSQLAKHISTYLLLALLLLGAMAAHAVPSPTPDPTWQYSVPLEPGTERRAYLWIPPACTHVRAVLFGLQNMLERPMFEDPDIRAAAAWTDMAIVLISPGAWPDKAVQKQPTLNYEHSRDKDEAIASVKRVLADLAKESGYSEIEHAPLLLTGHSAASPFIWGLTQAWPERVFAVLPFKGYPVPQIVDTVPTLKVEQEWAEWGSNWGEVWRQEMQQAAEKVRLAQHPLFGDFVDLGAGHFDWHHEAAPVIAMFFKKAVAARVPDKAPLTGPVTLKPVSPESGVLVAPEWLGTSQFKAVPYKDWTGDPREAFWYFDREMAETINRHMLERLAKKPQMIDFVVDGKPVPLTANGFAALKPEFLSDGIRFRVHAEPLAASPTPRLYGGQTLGDSKAPITYRVSSGALQQVGPDTFMVGARAGGLTRQGLPWEPWIMAYKAEDSEYRSADRPAHVLIDVRNKNGAAQTLQFAKIADVKAGTKRISLRAQASSGLPVQFYVESGPAVVEGSTLHFLPIPPRSRFPVRVIVSAYQWGRVGDKPVQSAGSESQEFFIRR